MDEFSPYIEDLAEDIEASIISFTGKEVYELGDISLAIDSRVKTVVMEFTGTGKEYEFGDITRELEKRRQSWVKDFTGKKEYEFGDITKKAVQALTSKDEYEFGDVSKAVVRNLENFFGKKEDGK